MQRGEIYYANLNNEENHQRTIVVILCSDNQLQGRITVIPITYQDAERLDAGEIALQPSDIISSTVLIRRAKAKAHHLRTIDFLQLEGGRLGRLAPAKLRLLDNRLVNFLGMTTANNTPEQTMLAQAIETFLPVNPSESNLIAYGMRSLFNVYDGYQRQREQTRTQRIKYACSAVMAASAAFIVYSFWSKPTCSNAQDSSNEESLKHSALTPY